MHDRNGLVVHGTVDIGYMVVTTQNPHGEENQMLGGFAFKILMKYWAEKCVFQQQQQLSWL